MGQVLHGCARTTGAARRAIQHSQAGPDKLAPRYGANPRTVAKRRRRESIRDAPAGPETIRPTVLAAEEEAAIAAFRKYTSPPLDDCLYSLQASMPHLARPSPHRCLQRHGISRLPEAEGGKPDKKKFT